MDALKNLHTSIAQAFDKAFDGAYRDLYAEIVSRDSKVEVAEKKAKCAEEARDEYAAEIQQLNHEIGILREELVRSDARAEGAQATVDQVSKLKEAFSPENTFIFGDSDTVCDATLEAKNEIAKEKYTALYNDFMTLVKATDGLKAQIKRHKRKLTYWRECLDRDNFTLVLDGIPVRFERIQRTVSRSKIQHPTTSYEAKPTPLVDEGSKKGDSKRHLQPFSPQPDDQFGMPPVRPQHEPSSPNPSLLASIPVPTPKSALVEPGNEGNSQQASPAANNPKSPRVSKRGSLEPCRLSAGDLPSDDSMVYNKSDNPTVLGPEQVPSCLVGRSSHQTKSHRIWERNVISNNADLPKGKEYNASLRHEKPPLIDLPPLLGTIDDNPGPSTASSESSGYITGFPLHRNRGDGPGLNMRHDKNSRESLKHAISSIAEDSDEGSRKRLMRNLPRDALLGTKCSFHPGGNAASTERRLYDLLESPLPPRHLLQQREGIQAGVCGENPSKQMERDLANPADVDESSNLQSASSHGNVPQISAQPEVPCILSSSADDCDDSGVHPVDVPYRARPLHQLDLSHFKINPSYNSGLDFAYDDVVRKRHERESIQACTRPDCCGQKFSAMVRLGGVPTHTENIPKEDREIIEDFLGEQNGIVEQMTAVEYQDILHEAKASLIAKNYGRHRHHHQRPCTPPGFWRADMPDTQEVEYDHREALKVEREKVKERYRQSMRPGGLWKFADE